ncbi:hypothetical protein EVAR_26877_1 [Eumeta japonica]|uniref:Uncharacterized protein n=1 Tax=Eumeta variegata TaxID=151549 RepID=A0A4C1VY69_EUMVA|nr:hypothetical protein EVAR_26877_1 [Eumeta japonica]
MLGFYALRPAYATRPNQSIGTDKAKFVDYSQATLFNVPSPTARLGRASRVHSCGSVYDLLECVNVYLNFELDLLNSRGGNETGPTRSQRLEKWVHLKDTVADDYVTAADCMINDENKNEIMMGDIIKALKRMKFGKAAEYDRVSSEMLRGGGDGKTAVPPL